MTIDNLNIDPLDPLKSINNAADITANSVSRKFGINSDKTQKAQKDDANTTVTNDATVETLTPSNTQTANGLDGLTIDSVATESPSRKSSMRTSAEDAFRYSKNIESFEDPTFLIFHLKIDEDSSPLFDGKNSAMSFIDRYSNISEIENRKPILLTFQRNLKEILEKKYYINSIGGLDKLVNKMAKYGDDILTITLSEDVALRASLLAELYNNLSYSYKNQRYLIPENCLRFDLMLEITDMRTFNIVNKVDGQYVSTTNTNPPRMIYTLHDCNFNFFKSKPFEDNIAIAGFGTALISNASSIKFDIKYKSVEKEFVNTLVNYGMDSEIRLIRNKQSKIINFKETSATNTFNNIKSITRINQESNQNKIDNTKYKSINTISDLIDSPNPFNDSVFNTRTNPDGTTDDKSVDKDKLLTKLKNNSKDLIESYQGTVKKLINRDEDGNINGLVVDVALDNIDGYINDAERAAITEVGKLFNPIQQMIISKINPGFVPFYPENIYKFDLSKYVVTPQTFLQNLGNDYTNLLNDTIEEFRDNTITQTSNSIDDVTSSGLNSIGIG
jgi:hypothetical protein